MAIDHWIPVGTTEPQTFTAYTDDAIVDMTGLSISVTVADKRGAVVALTGTVDWSDAVNAVWSYTPDGQLTPDGSPYTVRLTVTDGTGAALKFPNAEKPDRWWIVA